MEIESKFGSGLGANVAGGVAICAFSSCWILELVVLYLADFPFLDLEFLDLGFGGSG